MKKAVTNPNGTTSAYTYDAADRMDTITHVGPSGTISSYAYSYDPNSNRQRQVEQNAGRTETTDYTYDFVNRLQTVTYPGKAVVYEYDKSGNRIQEVTTGAEASDETFHYDAINRLERITDNLGDADVVYAYDANGNTTSKTKSGVTTTFHYDIRDQLGEVRQASNVLGRYGYDYQGRRILKIGNDGRRQYTYDQLSVITEADPANATVSKYDYGMDQLVRLDNRAEGRSFFHLDGLRSTVGLTDAAGGSRQSIFYDAWGNERDRIGSSTNKFTFTGHELDGETGLIYAKARYYDSDVGRFLTQDSFLGEVGRAPTLHRYLYALANPLRFFDPTGFQSEDVQDEEEFDFASAFRENDPNFGRGRIDDEPTPSGQESPEGPVTEEGMWSAVVRKYNQYKERFREWSTEELGARGRGILPEMPQTERQRMGEDANKAVSDRDANLRAAAEEAEKSVNVHTGLQETGEEGGRVIGQHAPEVAEQIAIAVTSKGVGKGLRGGAPRGPKKPGVVAQTVKRAVDATNRFAKQVRRKVKGIPEVQGKTNREMLRDAVTKLKQSGGTQGQKAELFEEFIDQINDRGGSFRASRTLTVEGAEVFAGRQGDLLVIDSAGEIFRGKLDALKFLEGGAAQVNFDALTKIK